MPKNFEVQRRQCKTCIFRKQHWPSGFLEAKLDEIKDPNMAGFFLGYRICHHSKAACCAGFWARHKDDFTLGQIAQRLGFVEYCCDGLQERMMGAEPQKDYPDDTWAREVCKVKQGATCCRYLVLGGDPVGWSCAKHSWLRSLIDNRVALGTMAAQGDNCQGKDMR